MSQGWKFDTRERAWEQTTCLTVFSLTTILSREDSNLMGVARLTRASAKVGAHGELIGCATVDETVVTLEESRYRFLSHCSVLGLLQCWPPISTCVPAVRPPLSSAMVTAMANGNRLKQSQGEALTSPNSCIRFCFLSRLAGWEEHHLRLLRL
jgi:hypothetical protein